MIRRAAIGRETQVRLMKCLAFTFSVVILPPHVPQLRLSVWGSPFAGTPIRFDDFVVSAVANE